MAKQNILILGYGLLGADFSRLYGSDYQIRGIRRSPLHDAAPIVIQMAIQDVLLRSHLEWADVIIFCPAPEGKHLAQYRETYLENMQFLLDLLKVPPRLPRIILISSTGVYPRASDGQWREDDAIPIETPIQEVLLSTEQALIKSGVPYAILRSGGLYGEGRGYYHRVMKRGFINQSEMSDAWMTSVHQDDLCGVINRIIQRNRFGVAPLAGEIYNVVDDTDMRKKALVEWIAKAFELPIVSDGPPPPALNRRIGTEKLTAQLGYTFRYKTAITFLEERKRRIR